MKLLATDSQNRSFAATPAILRRDGIRAPNARNATLRCMAGAFVRQSINANTMRTERTSADQNGEPATGSANWKSSRNLAVNAGIAGLKTRACSISTTSTLHSRQDQCIANIRRPSDSCFGAGKWAIFNSYAPIATVLKHTSRHGKRLNSWLHKVEQEALL